MTFDTMLILYEHKYIKLFQVINIKIKTLKLIYCFATLAGGLEKLTQTHTHSHVEKLLKNVKKKPTTLGTFRYNLLCFQFSL